MEAITIFDGLMLTVVSMLVVFLILAAIWGLVEGVAKFVQEPVTATEAAKTPAMSKTSAILDTENPVTLAPNAKHQKAAEIMALILASEDEPDKKFEIVESKRVK